MTIFAQNKLIDYLCTQNYNHTLYNITNGR
jgi:hypothetical protein